MKDYNDTVELREENVWGMCWSVYNSTTAPCAICNEYVRHDAEPNANNNNNDSVLI